MKTTPGVVTGIALSFCIVLSLCSVLSAMASISENTEPVLWKTAGQQGVSTVSNIGGGRVEVGFAARDASQPPSPVATDIVAGGDPGVVPFVGDYVASGISNLAFKISADVATSAVVQVILCGGYSGCTWARCVSVPTVAGAWITNVVSMRFDAGWMNDGAPDAAQQWSRDIRDVRFVGVRLIPGGRGAQTFTLDSFILVGRDFSVAPAVLLALGDALEARFGVRNWSQLSDVQKRQDADGDGMTDLNEILAGTNPDDRNSVFAAQVVGRTAAGVTIRWPCVEGGVYTVSRTSDLVGGTFTALSQGYRLTATTTGHMEFTDGSAVADGGPYFYRIVKE